MSTIWRAFLPVYSLLGALLLLAGLALVYAYAQEQPAQPKRDQFFWCQQQRNFFADNAASNAAEAARLQDELAAVKKELEELKKAAAPSK